jgi:tetratricopeptide (TPR) repeat protein
MIFTQNLSLAEEELLLKSDLKTAYIQYNKALKEKLTAENYLNMCKVTFILNDKDAARKYCKASMNEIEKEKNPDYELKSNILAMTGDIYSTVYRNSNITFDYYNQAKEYKEKNPETNKYDLAELYRDIAYVYDYTNRNDLAKTYREKALKIADEQEGKEFNNIKALIYKDMAEYEGKNLKYTKEKEYLDKALEYALKAEEYHNYMLCGDIYNKIADYYELKKDKKNTIENRKNALKEYSKFPDQNLIDKEIPEDENENETIENIKRKLDEFPYDVDLNVMAGSYYILNDKDLAEKYFKNAINVNPVNAYVYAAISAAYAEKYNENKIKDYKMLAKQYAADTEKYANYEPDIYLTLGLVNVKLYDMSAANKAFEFYIENTKDKYESYCEIAALIWYNDSKMQYRNYVVKYLEKAKSIKELNSIYKLMLASAYKQIGKQKEANNTATDLIKDRIP